MAIVVAVVRTIPSAGSDGSKLRHGPENCVYEKNRFLPIAQKHSLWTLETIFHNKSKGNTISLLTVNNNYKSEEPIICIFRSKTTTRESVGSKESHQSGMTSHCLLSLHNPTPFHRLKLNLPLLPPSRSLAKPSKPHTSQLVDCSSWEVFTHNNFIAAGTRYEVSTV